MDYSVLAYYFFVPLKEPLKEVLKHKDFFSSRDIKCRVYISEQGINGQLSGSRLAALEYMDWLSSDAQFRGIEFKLHQHHEHCFPRATVKYRKQLVAIDAPVDMSSNAGLYLSPKEWKERLATRDPNLLLIDVRNDYESKIGHFEGAELPPLKQFREFPDYVHRLKERYPPKTTSVLIYCTGGIRCEVYSVILKEGGFDQVYQLQGGVIKYGLSEGSSYWRGKLFVFDDRLAVSLSEENASEVIAQCSFCSLPSDSYLNCANMDCNELFISCPTCAQIQKGCCSSLCQLSPKVRPVDFTATPKPFRRFSHAAALSS